MRRFVDDEVARLACRFDGGDSSEFEFVCECGDLRCRGIVRMTLEDYAKTMPGSVAGHD